MSPPQCAEDYREYRRLVENEPLPAGRFSQWLRLRTAAAGLGGEFADRARLENIRFSADSERHLRQSQRSWRPLVGGLAAVCALLVLMAWTGWSGSVLSRRSSFTAVLSQRLTGLESSYLRSEAEKQAETERADHLGQQLASAHDQNASDAAVLATLRRQLATSQSEAASLRQKLSQNSASNSQIALQLQAREQAIASLQAQLSSARADEAAQDAELAEQQNKLTVMGGVTTRLQAQKSMLDQEGQLLSADRDIRDLMGARNLHVVDVYDFDAHGKTRKLSGRVFYTEGKSLIFYAYDLGTRSVRNASFQAWGQHEGGSRRPVNLGIFYRDQKAHSCWVLKFDNPAVLREIDSVFVTIEPPGGRERPSGRKLLYAFLKNPPNHP